MTSFFTCPDLPKHKFTFTVVRMREPHVFLLPDELQLCRDKARILDKAFDFGVHYKKDCPISVENLFSDPDYATYFYDLCIPTCLLTSSTSCMYEA